MIVLFPGIVKMVFYTKYYRIFCTKCHLAFLKNLWYYNNVRRGKTPTEVEKKTSEKSKKTLDKLKNLCYNKGTRSRGADKPQQKTEKVRKAMAIAMIRSELPEDTAVLQISERVFFFSTPDACVEMERRLNRERRELLVQAAVEAERLYHRVPTPYNAEAFRRAFKAAWGRYPQGV